MTFLVQTGEDSLNDLLVPWLSGADEIVVGQLELCGEALPDGGQFITILLRLLAFGESSLLHFLAVLIQTGQKENFQAKTAAGTRNNIGHDLLVSVAEVRLAIDIVNGGREGEQNGRENV